MQENAQWPEGVYVRNTFIDFQLPEPTAISRGQTVPKSFGSTLDKNKADTGGIIAENAVDEAAEDEDDAEAEAEADEPEDENAEVEALKEYACTKVTTVDCYEPAKEWTSLLGNIPPQALGMGAMMPPTVDSTMQSSTGPMAGSAMPPIATMPGQATMPAATGSTMMPAPATGSTMMPAPATGSTMMPAPVAGGYAGGAAPGPGAAMPAPMYMPAGSMPGMMAVPMMPMPMMPVPMAVGGDGSMMMPMMDLRQPERGVRWPAEMHQGNSTAADGSVQSGGMMPVMAVDFGHAGMPVQQQPDQSATGPPQPHTLTRTFSVTRPYVNRLNWTVDARKLKGNDKQAVSPPFEMSFGPDYPSVIFKMMLYPKVVSDSKGGASFKKARGFGFVQLKCEAELDQKISNVKWRIMIGQEDFRGPVLHNFSNSAVSRLPKNEEEWDFNVAVESESQTFVVCLEIVPADLERI